MIDIIIAVLLGLILVCEGFKVFVLYKARKTFLRQSGAVFDRLHSELIPQLTESSSAIKDNSSLVAFSVGGVCLFSVVFKILRYLFRA